MNVITLTELTDAILATLDGDVDIATFDEATEKARFMRFGEPDVIAVIVRARADHVQRVLPILSALGTTFVATALQYVKEGHEEDLLHDLKQALEQDYRAQLAARAEGV